MTIAETGGHAAEPFDPRDAELGTSKCRFCGDDIRIVPAGAAHHDQRAWVHSDGYIVSFN